MMFKHIASFREGDSVPDWLLAAEPREPGATSPKMTFHQDVHVVETTDGYWVMNDRLRAGKTLIFVDGTACGCNNISAASRRVILVTHMNCFSGPDDGDDGGEDVPFEPVPPRTSERI